MAPKKRQRRERGSGSIYQNKDGSWTAQERIEDRIVRRRAPTEQTARSKLAELQDLKRQGIAVHDGTQTYERWLNACYVEKVRLVAPKARTDEHLRSMMERYIIPALGARRLIDLKPTHIQSFVDQLYEDIRADGKYDGARTTRAAAAVVKETITLAFERRLIPSNPYSGIRLPKYRRKKIVPMTDEQVRAVVAVIRGARLEVLWMSYLLLGWRRGEGLGVRWQDFDRERRTIRVEQQVQRVEEGEHVKVITNTPKTEDSLREVPLPRRLYDAYCARWDDAQAEYALRGLEWTGQGLIFPSEANTPMWPDNLEKQWRTLRLRAKLPATIKLHHCRHTLATLLDECGATQALKESILGHSAQTQSGKYTHGRIEAMRVVLQAVEDRLLGDVAILKQTGT